MHRRPSQRLWNAIWQRETRSQSSNTQCSLPIKCWWNRRAVGVELHIAQGHWTVRHFASDVVSCHRLDTRGCPCPRNKSAAIRSSRTYMQIAPSFSCQRKINIKCCALALNDVTEFFCVFCLHSLAAYVQNGQRIAAFAHTHNGNFTSSS